MLLHGAWETNLRRRDTPTVHRPSAGHVVLSGRPEASGLLLSFSLWRNKEHQKVAPQCGAAFRRGATGSDLAPALLSWCVFTVSRSRDMKTLIGRSGGNLQAAAALMGRRRFPWRRLSPRSGPPVSRCTPVTSAVATSQSKTTCLGFGGTDFHSRNALRTNLQPLLSRQRGRIQI